MPWHWAVDIAAVQRLACPQRFDETGDIASLDRPGQDGGGAGLDQSLYIPGSAGESDDPQEEAAYLRAVYERIATEEGQPPKG